MEDPRRSPFGSGTSGSCRCIGQSSSLWAHHEDHQEAVRALLPRRVRLTNPPRSVVGMAEDSIPMASCMAWRNTKVWWMTSCLPRCPGYLCWQSHVSRRLFINRLSHPPSITSYLRPPFPPAIRRLSFLVHHQDSLATVLACNNRGSRVKVLASLILPGRFSTTICYLDNRWTQSCSEPWSLHWLWPGLPWQPIPRGTHLPIEGDMVFLNTDHMKPGNNHLNHVHDSDHLPRNLDF